MKTFHIFGIYIIYIYIFHLFDINEYNLITKFKLVSHKINMVTYR